MTISVTDSLATIIHLINPENPGILYPELVKALFHCWFCDKVMVPNFAESHKCVFDLDSSDDIDDEILVIGHVLNKAEYDSDVEVLN